MRDWGKEEQASFRFRLKDCSWDTKSSIHFLTGTFIGPVGSIDIWRLCNG